jgi:hypothetical protein
MFQIAPNHELGQHRPVLFMPAGNIQTTWVCRESAAWCHRHKPWHKLILWFATGSTGSNMAKNPVLDLPLHNFMRAEIALTLQKVLQIHTVGSLLNAWRSPKNQKSIEQVFDTPQQARHAISVCATWLGVSMGASPSLAGGWWRTDDHSSVHA